MPNSYQSHVANGVSNSFSFASIDGYLQLSHLKVYVNGTLRATNTYTIDAAAKTVSLSTAPASGDVVKVARETPNTVATRPVDFTDGSVLTATDLDTANLQTIFLAQEAADSGGAAFQKTATNQSWDAQSIRISAVAPPTSGTDAATKDYVDALGLVGGLGGAPVAEPQAWAFTSTGASSYTLNPAPNASTAVMMLVEVGGALQHPGTDYTISGSTLTFTGSPLPESGIGIRVRNFGIARSITESVGESLIASEAVTASKIGTGAVVTDKIQNNAINAAKLSAGFYASGTFSPTYILSASESSAARGTIFTYDAARYGTYTRIGNILAVTIRVKTNGSFTNDDSSSGDLLSISVSGIPTGFTFATGTVPMHVSYANFFGPSGAAVAPAGALWFTGNSRIALYTRTANQTFVGPVGYFTRSLMDTTVGANDIIISGFAPLS